MQEVLRMLHVYREFAEQELAIPVIAGRKSEAEKFAGAEATFTVEAMMGDGNAFGLSAWLVEDFQPDVRSRHSSFAADFTPGVVAARIDCLSEVGTGGTVYHCIVFDVADCNEHHVRREIHSSRLLERGQSPPAFEGSNLHESFGARHSAPYVHGLSAESGDSLPVDGFGRVA